MKKVIPVPVFFLYSVSPDGKYLAAWAPGGGVGISIQYFFIPWMVARPSRSAAHVADEPAILHRSWAGPWTGSSLILVSGRWPPTKCHCVPARYSRHCRQRELDLRTPRRHCRVRCRSSGLEHFQARIRRSMHSQKTPRNAISIEFRYSDSEQGIPSLGRRSVYACLPLMCHIRQRHTVPVFTQPSLRSQRTSEFRASTLVGNR